MNLGNDLAAARGVWERLLKIRFDQIFALLYAHDYFLLFFPLAACVFQMGYIDCSANFFEFFSLY